MEESGDKVTKVQTNKQQKEDALLSAAFDIFTTQGINKASISDIVKKAGVAKGTFYLYFTDKYDIRNKLIAKKASTVFSTAIDHLKADGVEGMSLTDTFIFIVNDVLDQFVADKSLLNFISKNLSWGIFKGALTGSTASENDVDFNEVFEFINKSTDMPEKDLEITLYLIVEFVSSTCYSSILYSEPAPIDDIKPYIFSVVRYISENQVKQSDNYKLDLPEEVDYEHVHEKSVQAGNGQ